MSPEARGDGMLGRAFDTLLAVAELGPSDAKAISDQAGLPLSTTYRLLSTLSSKGFLQKRDGLFEIGWATYFLANVAADASTLPHRAQPILRALSSQTGETAILGVRGNDHWVIVGISEADKELRMTFPLGTQLPLERGAAGRVFLAYDAKSKQHDPKIREQGYALSDEEVAAGVRAIAAPVFDHLGALACVIVIAGPKDRIKLGPKMIAPVTAAANELSSLLGHGVRPPARSAD